MGSKRIIGVLTVKDGGLVKSYGYRTWRPAGALVTALRNLDRWAADEIVVLDISRRNTVDSRVLRQIACAGIGTPLAYGGGIRSVADLTKLMEIGCDRFVLESLLFEDSSRLTELADLVGRQALIGSVPLFSTPDGWAVWRPNPGHGLAPPFGDAAALQALLAAMPISEYFITSVEAEGQAGRFPTDMPAQLRGLPVASAIWFGGLDIASATVCLGESATAAVAFGNLLHETELALPRLRAALRAAAGDDSLRSVRTLSA